jgi:hypothetical protein
MLIYHHAKRLHKKLISFVYFYFVTLRVIGFLRPYGIRMRNNNPFLCDRLMLISIDCEMCDMIKTYNAHYRQYNQYRTDTLLWGSAYVMV